MFPKLLITFLTYLFAAYNLKFKFCIGIQLNGEPGPGANYTSRQGQGYFQYQQNFQIQYQPMNPNPNWQTWPGYHSAMNSFSNPTPNFNSQISPTIVQGSAIPVLFPGPVNENVSSNFYNNGAGVIIPSSGGQNRDKNPNAGVRISDTCKCGVLPKSRSLERITGGMLSKDNAWPFMAAVVYTGSDAPFWFCGASLINDRYLITAAHCQKTIKRRGVSNIKVLLGVNGIPSSARASELYEISELKTHPLYKPNIEEYDIGLIKLKNKISYSDKISPICLTQRGTPFTDRMATVAGWGSIKYGDSPPDTLREVEIKVVPNASCQREYLYNYGSKITSAMLCAWSPGKDSCQGDSGGPLFLKTANEPHVYTQIGVVSFGPPQCGETTIPGVYTRVASTIRWIKANTRDATYCSGAF